MPLAFATPDNARAHESPVLSAERPLASCRSMLFRSHCLDDERSGDYPRTITPAPFARNHLHTIEGSQKRFAIFIWFPLGGHKNRQHCASRRATSDIQGANNEIKNTLFRSQHFGCLIVNPVQAQPLQGSPESKNYRQPKCARMRKLLPSSQFHPARKMEVMLHNSLHLRQRLKLVQQLYAETTLRSFAQLSTSYQQGDLFGSLVQTSDQSLLHSCASWETRNSQSLRVGLGGVHAVGNERFCF